MKLGGCKMQHFMARVKGTQQSKVSQFFQELIILKPGLNSSHLIRWSSNSEKIKTP